MTTRIETDPDLLRSFLSDAAHVPGGFASGLAFPRSADDVATLVAHATSILPIGAQSSLTGGATPRGELLLSTRALTDVSIDASTRRVRVGAGVPLHTLQAQLARQGLWYPPAPTFDGAFVGGTVSTNAAGAATFKYGTTRSWIEGLTIALADGALLSLTRGQVLETAGEFMIPDREGLRRLPAPQYAMPSVPKLSAGYFAKPGMDLVDLFVGSEGTLGVIVDALLRVIDCPKNVVTLIQCSDTTQALALTRTLRARAHETWQGRGDLDVSAIEFMDARSLAFVPDIAFARAGVVRPAAGQVLLLVQLEVAGEMESAIEALAGTLADIGVDADPIIALPGDDAAAQVLFELREAVPASVNAAIAAAKQEEPDIQKTAGDFIVPFDALDASLAVYREAFESRGVNCAIWGHVSDGNLHPNAVPRSRDEMLRGRDALAEAARWVIAAGGSPLAEHGVGRSAMKQHLLLDLYGDTGVEQMRAVKRALDPLWKLSPGVLFERV